MTRYSVDVDEQVGRFLHKADEDKVDALLDALDAMDEDEAIRTVAGWTAARRIRVLEDRGVTITPTWHPIPDALLANQRQVTYAVDHPHQRDAPGRPTRYVSEPYDIGSKAILALASLVQQGWDVLINGRDSIHFPGDTIHIELIPPDGLIEEAQEEDG